MDDKSLLNLDRQILVNAFLRIQQEKESLLLRLKDCEKSNELIMQQNKRLRSFLVKHAQGDFNETKSH